jgi:hypothetical protein
VKSFNEDRKVADMSGSSDGLRVPVALREIVGEIVQITDRVCADYLDTEYASLSTSLAFGGRRQQTPARLGRPARARSALLPRWASM